MSKTRQQKEQTLDSLKQRIKDSNSFIVSVFNKLNVSDDQKLRHELRTCNVNYEVIKKTLLKKALEENKIEGLVTDEIFGNISIASSQDDAMGAKILVKFSETKEDFKIIGGLLNKIWVSHDKILELAKLPSRDGLLSKTVWTIKAPLSGLVNVLSGNIRGLVNVLKAIKDKSNG